MSKDPSDRPTAETALQQLRTIIKESHAHHWKHLRKYYDSNDGPLAEKLSASSPHDYWYWRIHCLQARIAGVGPLARGDDSPRNPIAASRGYIGRSSLWEGLAKSLSKRRSARFNESTELAAPELSSRDVD
jgi:hypothetical protein